MFIQWILTILTSVCLNNFICFANYMNDLQKVADVFKLPFPAALVPGLADLFLMPLSRIGSSSTSFSARELRRLGPLGFSTAALGGPDRKTSNKKEGRTKQGCVSKDAKVCVNSALLRERYNTTQDSAVFPRLPQILSVFILTASTTSTWSLLVSLQRKHVQIHTLGLSWWAPFFSLPICDRSGKTAVNYKLCWKNTIVLSHHIISIPRKKKRFGYTKSVEQYNLLCDRLFFA